MCGVVWCVCMAGAPPPPLFCVCLRGWCIHFVLFVSSLLYTLLPPSPPFTPHLPTSHHPTQGSTSSPSAGLGYLQQDHHSHHGHHGHSQHHQDANGGGQDGYGAGAPGALTAANYMGINTAGTRLGKICCWLLRCAVL